MTTTNAFQRLLLLASNPPIQQTPLMTWLSLTETNFGPILLKYFEHLDIFSIGENAINLVQDIKSNTYVYKWISSDLKSYCDTKLLSNDSTHVTDVTPNRGAYVANTNTAATIDTSSDLSLNTSLFEQLNAKLDRMDACFNLISNACITSTAALFELPYY